MKYGSLRPVNNFFYSGLQFDSIEINSTQVHVSYNTVSCKTFQNYVWNTDECSVLSHSTHNAVECACDGKQSHDLIDLYPKVIKF